MGHDLSFGPVITEEDALGAVHAIRLSFGGSDTTARRYLERFSGEVFIVRSRELGGARGESATGVVGCVTLLPMGHWLGGRCVPMLGVRAVAVPPEHRGRGIATWMMRAVVARARDQGYPLSTLYASTQSLYRSAGYELAGWRFEHAVEPGRVRCALPSGTLQSSAMTPDDHGDIRALYEASCPACPGALRRSESFWSDLFAPRKHDADGLVYRDRNGTLRAYALYSLDSSKVDPLRPYDVRVRDFAAIDAEGWASLVGFIASFGTLAHRVHFACGPSNPLLMATTEAMRARQTELWMMRVCDAPAAFMARGYAPGVNAEFIVQITDDLIPANGRAWSVRVNKGAALVATVDSNDSSDALTITTGVHALGPLITGHQHPRALASLGLMSGDLSALDAVGAVFAGPSPGLVDMF